MNKYFSIFKTSFAQEFAYKVNFIMWRLRNVFQIFLVFFLWDAVFQDPEKIVFGYDRAMILTYVFGLMIIKAFVLSARAREVASDISEGKLSIYLLKPVSYFKYWLTRDFSSKALNLMFATGEVIILFLILKPPFFLQTNPISILGFLLAIIIAILVYFILLFIISFVTFWVPEAGWGAHFLVTVVVVEFLSGSLFPLDILPINFQNILNLTPFPYLIFFPLQVYLGKITGAAIFKGLLISSFWAFLLYLFMNSLWKKGLKVYQGHGQ